MRANTTLEYTSPSRLPTPSIESSISTYSPEPKLPGCWIRKAVTSAAEAGQEPVPETTAPPAGASHQAVAPLLPFVASFGSWFTSVAEVYRIRAAPVPWVMEAASKVKVPLKEVSSRPLRGSMSITSGLLIACASGFGNVFVMRTRHLFSSLLAWPSRLTCTTGVRATFSSLMPARLESCTEA